MGFQLSFESEPSNDWNCRRLKVDLGPSRSGSVEKFAKHQIDVFLRKSRLINLILFECRECLMSVGKENTWKEMKKNKRCFGMETGHAHARQPPNTRIYPTLTHDCLTYRSAVRLHGPWSNRRNGKSSLAYYREWSTFHLWHSFHQIPNTDLDSKQKQINHWLFKFDDSNRCFSLNCRAEKIYKNRNKLIRQRLKLPPEYHERVFHELLSIIYCSDVVLILPKIRNNYVM